MRISLITLACHVVEASWETGAQRRAPIAVVLLGLLAVAGGVMGFWAEAGFAFGLAAIWLGRVTQASIAAKIGTVLGAAGCLANVIVPLGDHFRM